MSETGPAPDDFLAGLDVDLDQEARRERRVETWLFVRACLILAFVIGVVVIRSLLL